MEIRKYELHTRQSIQFQADTGMRYQPEIMDRVLVAALKGGARNRVFNFRKDEFKKRKTSREFRHLLVRVAAPLVLAVLALIGYGVYEYTHLLAQQEQLRSQIHGVFRETVPEISRIVNPVQQLQVINNQIGATYKPGGNERAGITIIDLLAELSSRIPVSYQVKVVRLLADADTLRFKAITGNFNTVDNIQKELGKSPYFKNVVISSANQSSQNDEVTFELKLELARK
jgi:type II secretory pathway component PulL